MLRKKGFKTFFFFFKLDVFNDVFHNFIGMLANRIIVSWEITWIWSFYCAFVTL